MSERSTPVSGAVTADLAGRVLAGRYSLTHLIATGGMAQVWGADDQVLARPVAVKVLHSHLAADDAFVRRFRHEAIAAARLSHPSIVSIYDTVSDEGVEAIVMELVRGITLRTRLDRVHTLEVPDAVAAGAQVADALEVAHRALVVHRDIKPANILLNADGRVMVADFGIAKALQAGDRTAEGTMLGTAKYLAPEQVEGTQVDGRTDMYSLGVVLYEALCGRPPFQEDNDAATALARLHRVPLRPRQIRAGVPRPVEDVVMRAMSARPDDRYGTAAEMRAALLASLHGEVPGTLPPPAPAMLPPTALPATAPTATVRPGSDAAGADHHRPTVANVPATGLPGAPPAPPGTFPPSAPASEQPSFSRSERRWLLPALLIVLVAVALGVAGVLLSRSQGAKKFLGGNADAKPTAVQLTAASSYDPQGDGSEGVRAGANASRVLDHDPSSLWQTDHYHSPGATFGGLPKQGVGIYVVSDRAQALKQLTVTSPDSGWSASVYVAQKPPPSQFTRLEPFWGQAIATKSSIHAGTTTFDLHDAKGKVVLLWITRLPSGGQLGVGDVGVTA